MSSRSCPHQTRAEIVRAIVAQRRELETRGHDAGAETIAYHLAQFRKEVPFLSTVWRVLTREALVVHEPRKRPRCSLIRFEAELPNQCWHADVSAWQLATCQFLATPPLIPASPRL